MIFWLSALSSFFSPFLFLPLPVFPYRRWLVSHLKWTTRSFGARASRRSRAPRPACRPWAISATWRHLSSTWPIIPWDSSVSWPVGQRTSKILKNYFKLKKINEKVRKMERKREMECGNGMWECEEMGKTYSNLKMAIICVDFFKLWVSPANLMGWRIHRKLYLIWWHW